MAKIWMVMPGGRVKQFKSPQVWHDCRKRRHGRPSVGHGPCYRVNEARWLRRRLRAELRRAAGSSAALGELAAGVVRAPRPY